MNERFTASPSNPAIADRKSLAARILRRLMLVVLLPILSYGLLIVIWILMAPRL